MEHYGYTSRVSVGSGMKIPCPFNVDYYQRLRLLTTLKDVVQNKSLSRLSQLHGFSTVNVGVGPTWDPTLSP